MRSIEEEYSSSEKAAFSEASSSLSESVCVIKILESTVFSEVSEETAIESYADSTAVPSVIYTA